ncbi:VOC family protein [Hirschia baltica]|uniref:Glyoxalase/bleomycin resistance protein/dioxygenase n=1 Tax=Hirschia baltica (strain ATCC 49814 / DSM 5838 / IFAM 1418) TaxID=582402 RepID=C6XMJ9_HIRBI|nr:VOC family protein [Hirschia baltica]ACT59913.1 Glyoxalase/bleomycin resistance protein/dioxygenase [Hirschia baltica ATCC 49814]
MELGLFSLSLTVKDLQISKTFYEKIGFEVYGGHEDQGWLILKNGQTIIGIFEGMFDKNMLTFNPGWDAETNTLQTFTDVRDIQKDLKKNGVELTTQADETTTGPASFIVIDPDGNPILIDQHV